MENRLLCEDCGWKGTQEECVKKYRGIPLGEGESEVYLECPKCNSENLIPLIEELVPA